jgi:hypothetical protein
MIFVKPGIKKILAVCIEHEFATCLTQAIIPIFQRFNIADKNRVKFDAFFVTWPGKKRMVWRMFYIANIKIYLTVCLFIAVKQSCFLTAIMPAAE